MKKRRRRPDPAVMAALDQVVSAVAVAFEFIACVLSLLLFVVTAPGLLFMRRAHRRQRREQDHAMRSSGCRKWGGRKHG